ncbi:MAG: hypothetical protein [Bacteriophage sp.]|nr:MAG: hypothetical protein [Bacteriophage sp.]
MITENIIQAFAIAGGFGFINVLTLEQIGVQTFDDKSNKDRNIMLFSFSAFNYLVFQHYQNIIVTSIWSLFVTLLAIITLVFVYPLLRAGYDNLHNLKIFKNVSFSQSDPWDEFIESADNKDVSLYAFTLEDKFICGGEFSGGANSLQDKTFFINPYIGANTWRISNKDELENLIDTKNPTVEIYVNLEKGIKFYLLK